MHIERRLLPSFVVLDCLNVHDPLAWSQLQGFLERIASIPDHVSAGAEDRGHEFRAARHQGIQNRKTDKIVILVMLVLHPFCPTVAMSILEKFRLGYPFQGSCSDRRKHGGIQPASMIRLGGRISCPRHHNISLAASVRVHTRWICRWVQRRTRVDKQ